MNRLISHSFINQDFAQRRKQMQFLATAAFGMEGLAAGELRRLGYDSTAVNGGALFEGTFEDAMRANLYLRTADRVLLVIGTFEATTFESLFDQVAALPWEQYLTKDCRFPVSGNCARSQLMSVSDCQSITKKAIVRRLQDKYHINWFPESGPTVPISVTLHANQACLTIDTSGSALNRRGYRTWNGEAPLRETLAAALVDLSPWRPGMPLCDPFCGTGTLLIEAAFKMSHRAPGLTRTFALEAFPGVARGALDALRDEAKAAFDPSLIHDISGSDIDPEAISLAKKHIVQAGLGGHIQVSVRDMRNCSMESPTGVFLCNPPYGERLSDRKACESLYRDLGTMFARHPGWSLSAISSHPQFERCIGRRASKKRRFYNGRLECEFMTFQPKNR